MVQLIKNNIHFVNIIRENDVGLLHSNYNN